MISRILTAARNRSALALGAMMAAFVFAALLGVACGSPPPARNRSRQKRRANRCVSDHGRSASYPNARAYSHSNKDVQDSFHVVPRWKWRNLHCGRGWHECKAYYVHFIDAVRW